MTLVCAEDQAIGQAIYTRLEDRESMIRMPVTSFEFSRNRSSEDPLLHFQPCLSKSIRLKGLKVNRCPTEIEQADDLPTPLSNLNRFPQGVLMTSPLRPPRTSLNKQVVLPRLEERVPIRQSREARRLNLYPNSLQKTQRRPSTMPPTGVALSP